MLHTPMNYIAQQQATHAFYGIICAIQRIRNSGLIPLIKQRTKESSIHSVLNLIEDQSFLNNYAGYMDDAVKQALSSNKVIDWAQVASYACVNSELNNLFRYIYQMVQPQPEFINYTDLGLFCHAAVLSLKLLHSIARANPIRPIYFLDEEKVPSYLDLCSGKSFLVIDEESLLDFCMSVPPYIDEEHLLDFCMPVTFSYTDSGPDANFAEQNNQAVTSKNKR